MSALNPLPNHSEIGNSVYQPRPYRIAVEPSFVEQIRRKVADFRHSVEIDSPAWSDGPPAAEISRISTHWAEHYDWFAEQARINGEFSHYMTTVPPPGGKYDKTLDIHFIHERSADENAIPLLMLHGWPSTSLEWEKVIPGLVNPTIKSTRSFHVVAPDIPGYGFSPAPSTAGLGTAELANAFSSLMEQLGYNTFAVYSTDLGAFIALAMVSTYPTKITHHISDMLLIIPDDKDLARYQTNKTTPEECAYIKSYNAFINNHSAYSAIHSTFPLSIAYALNDSPVGFLGWMYNLASTVSDISYTADQIIRQTLLLYIPGVYGNIRSYKELFNFGVLTPKDKSPVPTSALQFGFRKGNAIYPGIENFNHVPRDWLDRYYNIVHFARHDKGGHFPAESEPELVLHEIRAALSK